MKFDFKSMSTWVRLYWIVGLLFVGGAAIVDSAETAFYAGLLLLLFGDPLSLIAYGFGLKNPTVKKVVIVIGGLLLAFIVEATISGIVESWFS